MPAGRVAGRWEVNQMCGPLAASEKCLSWERGCLLTASLLTSQPLQALSTQDPEGSWPSLPTCPLLQEPAARPPT